MSTPTSNSAGTIDGINYEELHGSGNLEINNDSAIGTRIFHVDWDDRNSFIAALMGGYITSGDNVIYTYKKSFPGYPILLASRVRVEGVGVMSCGTNGDFSYEFARVECTYEPKDEEQGTNEVNVLATEEMDAGFETIDFPPMSFMFAGSARIISEGVSAGKRYVITRHTLTEEKSPTNKKALIQEKTGKINSDTFLDVDPLKLLYTGARTRRVITASGEQPYKIVHTFLEISDTDASGNDDANWNRLYDTVNARWDTLLTAKDDACYNIYGSTSFSGSGLIG